MGIKDILVERLYLLVGIVIVITVLLLPMGEIYEASGSNYAAYFAGFFSLFMRSSSDTQFYSYYDPSTFSNQFVGPITGTMLLLALIGAALLIISGIVFIDNQKIQAILPGIGLGLAVFSMIFWTQFIVSEFAAAPILMFFWHSGSNSAYYGVSIGFWVGISAGSVGVIKYLLHK